jgi:hypothetical protein
MNNMISGGGFVGNPMMQMQMQLQMQQMMMQAPPEIVTDNNGKKVVRNYDGTTSPVVELEDG